MVLIVMIDYMAMSPDRDNAGKEDAIRKGLTVTYGKAIEGLITPNTDTIAEIERQERKRFGEMAYEVALGITYVKMRSRGKNRVFSSILICVTSDDTITEYTAPFTLREDEEPTIHMTSKTQESGMWDVVERASYETDSPEFLQLYPLTQQMATHPDIQQVVEAFGEDNRVMRVTATLGEQKIKKVTLSSFATDREFIRSP